MQGARKSKLKICILDEGFQFNLHYIPFNGQTNLLRIGARRRTGRQRVEIAGNPRAVLAAENAAIEL